MRSDPRAALLVGLGLACGVASANVGVPPLSNTVVTLVLWFIPIAAIEAFVLRKQLPLRGWAAVQAAVAANLASTAVGFALMFLEETLFVVPFVPMRLERDTVGDLVTLALLVPFCLLSIAIEYPVCRQMQKSLDARLLRRAVVLANLGSYLLLGAFLVARMAKSAIVHGTWVYRITW